MKENSKELQKVRKWTRLDMEIQRLHGSRVSKGMSLVWVGGMGTARMRRAVGP